MASTFHPKLNFDSPVRVVIANKLGTHVGSLVKLKICLEDETCGVFEDK